VDAATHEVKDHSLAVFTRQLAESRSAFRTQLDLYQIHSATLESGVLDDDRVIDALVTQRGLGLPMGLTVSGERQADTIWRALDVRRDGECVFDAVQATWNLLERAAAPALQAAHGEGLTVIIKESVANGRLTTRGLSTVARTAADRIEAEADRLSVSIDALAIAYVLAQPWVDVVLSGATTIDQLESNLAAVGFTLPADTLGRLEDARMDTGSYWAARSALPWN
jgi:aryl-alcohol dehydrogenase-like predicted oxidoreductase